MKNPFWKIFLGFSFFFHFFHFFCFLAKKFILWGKEEKKNYDFSRVKEEGGGVVENLSYFFVLFYVQLTSFLFGLLMLVVTNRYDVLPTDGMCFSFVFPSIIVLVFFFFLRKIFVENLFRVGFGFFLFFPPTVIIIIKNLTSSPK